MSEVVTAELAILALVFARIGAAVMVLPVFGEGYVLSRTRLAIALTLSIVLAPVLRTSLPPFEAFDSAYALILIGEVVHGLFVGSFVRLSIVALSIAGTAISMQMGFAAANFFNPADATQGSAPGNLLTAAGLVTLLLIDGHHGLLMGLVASYEALPPGNPTTAAGMAEAMARGSADAIQLGLQMAMPVTVASIVLYVVLGMMSRLVPTLQVIFVALPAQILMGLAILGLAMGTILEAYAGFVAELLLTLGT